MKTHQPIWEYITNLGDSNPIDYGGYFIVKDNTCIYPPEAIKLISESDSVDNNKWTIYRFILEKCTYIDNILSDNKFHPTHSAWFSTETRLNDIASYHGINKIELINMFISHNIVENAKAWESIGNYFGFHELDNYPLQFTNKKELKSYLTKIVKYKKNK